MRRGSGMRVRKPMYFVPTREQFDDMEARKDFYKKQRDLRTENRKWVRIMTREENRKRENCLVCGKFIWIAVLHHIFPVECIYERSSGIAMSICASNVVWLCPNHHALVHKMEHFRPSDIIDELDDHDKIGFCHLLDKMREVYDELESHGELKGELLGCVR